MSRRRLQANQTANWFCLPNIAGAFGIDLTDFAQRNISSVLAESAAGDNASMGNHGPGGEGVSADPPTTT